MAIHDLHETIAIPDPDTGLIDFPSLMRDSHLFMAGHGVYLIGAPLHRRFSVYSDSYRVTDNEDIMMLWVGASVSPQVLRDLFGVDDIKDVDRNMVRRMSLCRNSHRLRSSP